MVSVNPLDRTVRTSRGTVIGYDRLVISPGIQLNWDNVTKVRSGTAIFHPPMGPIKCAGAPQKIAYLASDYYGVDHLSCVQFLLMNTQVTA